MNNTNFAFRADEPVQTAEDVLKMLCFSAFLGFMAVFAVSDKGEIHRRNAQNISLLAQTTGKFTKNLY